VFEEVDSPVVITSNEFQAMEAVDIFQRTDNNLSECVVRVVHAERPCSVQLVDQIPYWDFVFGSVVQELVAVNSPLVDFMGIDKESYFLFSSQCEYSKQILNIIFGKYNTCKYQLKISKGYHEAEEYSSYQYKK